MKKILIANPFGIGDAVFSLFVAEALRMQIPGAVIDFLGNERTEALLRMDETIRRVHTLDRDGLRRLWPARPGAFWAASSALLSAVRRERYDALFDFSLGREIAFYGFLFGIRRRIGFDYRGRGIFLNRKLPLDGYEGRHVALRQLELLPLAGLRIPELGGRLPLRVSSAAEAAASARLAEAGLAPGSLFVLAPGGGRSWGANAVYKQWNPERFADLAARLAARGLRPAMLGDESERGLLESVAAASKTGAPVWAGLPIGEVCALLRASKGLLANDGGLAHLASALGVRTAVIFGPVDESAYAPFIPPAGSRILTAPVPCRPCYGRFRFPPCAHERVCLEQLPVERVWSAVLEMV